MRLSPSRSSWAPWLLAAALMLTVVVYWPGLHGSFLFDDFPNIVDNKGVQPTDASVPSLVRAALSSPASEFKRPLASLSFAANYLAAGLDPFWWKLTNLLIHLLNGLLVFWLARMLLRIDCRHTGRSHRVDAHRTGKDTTAEVAPTIRDHTTTHPGVVAALIAAAWMLLPINLTGVLYVVQRMESMANVFVLLGLVGYTMGRQRMLAAAEVAQPASVRNAWKGFWLCAASITVPTAIGLLAKETAVMLPLYAVLIEWALFGLQKPVTQDAGESIVTSAQPARRWMALVGRALPVGLSRSRLDQEPAGSARPTESRPFDSAAGSARPTESRPSDRVAGGARLAQRGNAALHARDWRMVTLFLLVLALPMVIGLAWLVPHVLNPESWATRDFTLGTRLLSEARIVVDYIVWTLVPTPNALSFYHDDFTISTGLLTPWTTLAGIVGLAALAAFAVWVRARRPLVALGIALFLGCQLLTGTILPLELIYEHRNYFASFGLMLALVPLLAAPARAEPDAKCTGITRPSAAPASAEAEPERRAGTARQHTVSAETEPECKAGIAGRSALPVGAALAGTGVVATDYSLPLALPRYTLLGGLLLCWIGLTAFTAYTWGSQLRLAQDLAVRAPQSPRAQYELGRTYIIYSQYDPASPFTPLVYAPLERAAALPGSSILPEQALIFMNARMHLPLKDAWWDSLSAKLKAHPLGIQDESSLAALTQCVRDGHCALPAERMMQAFAAALSHPNPSARLLATYGDYAWNVLNDHALGERMTRDAVHTRPNEPAYQITLIRMLAAQGRKAEAIVALKQLETLNFGGRLNGSVDELRKLLAMPRSGR